MKLREYFKRYQDLSKNIFKNIEKYFIEYINQNELMYDKLKFYNNLWSIEKNVDYLCILNKTLNTFFCNFDYFSFLNNIFENYNISFSYANQNEFESIRKRFIYFQIIKLFKFEFESYKLFVLIYLENNLPKYKIFSFTNLDSNLSFSIENEDYFHENDELIQLENKEFEDSYHISYSKNFPIVKILEIFNIYVQECLHDLWKSNAFINKIYKENDFIFFDDSFLNFYEKTDYFNISKIDDITYFNSITNNCVDIDTIISRIIVDANWFIENIIKIIMHLITFEHCVIDYNFNNINFNPSYEWIVCNSPLYSFCNFYLKNKYISKMIPSFNAYNNYIILKLDLQLSDLDPTIENVGNEIINNHPMMGIINWLKENEGINNNFIKVNSINNTNRSTKIIDNQVIIKFKNNLPDFIISHTIPKFIDIYDFEDKKQLWMNNIHILSHNLKSMLSYEFIDKYASQILQLDHIAINEKITFINNNGYLFILSMQSNKFIKKNLVNWLLSLQNK